MISISDVKRICIGRSTFPLGYEASQKRFEDWFGMHYGGISLDVLDAKEAARKAWEYQRWWAKAMLESAIRLIGDK